MAEAVRVIVRCRPMNDRERNLECDVVVGMEHSSGQCTLKKPNSEGKVPPKMFTFDGVYFMEDTTENIYAEVAFPLVDSVLEGFNGTVFAYGQTGCGKSFTMMGIPDPPTQLGVIPRAFKHIFDRAFSTSSVKYLLSASYLEIYNEEVRDLLGKDVKQKLDLKEHPLKGVYVQGLSKHKVRSIPDLEHILELGSKNRSVGATLMNTDSSRSHSIFTINIESSQKMENGKENIRAGMLNLVDLAGSERQSKTGATGDRLKEATKINLSLSALGNVISALVDGKSKHIPYRDSKLTRLLQSSLGGNTKTLMVACISPADNNYDETLSTLRYANRAKNIKNKPKINEDPKDALLREYKEEIEKLKAMLSGELGIDLDQLSAKSSSTSPRHAVELSTSNIDLEAEREALRRKYEQEISQLKEQYSEEQETSASLQHQLKELQLAYQSAQDSLNAKVQTHSSGTMIGTSMGRQVSTSEMGTQQTELFEQIQQLEADLVGGEATNNALLQKELDEKRRFAEEHQKQVQEAARTLFLDDIDDDILVKIYSSLTEEVTAKHELALKERERRKIAEEEIKDLQAEFEIQRQDFLETIRQQQQRLQLQEQLIQTITPCLRSDCNYYNIDKIKSECIWNPETGVWTLPKLTVTRTELKSVPLSASNSTLQSAAASSPRRFHSHGILPLASQSSLTNTTEQINGLPEEEDQFLRQINHKKLSDSYFKSRRATELLAESQQISNKKIGGGFEGGHGSKSSLVHSQNVKPIPLKPTNDPLAVLERAEKKKSHKKFQLNPINNKPHF